jgi:DNA-binding NarL/FixJ family response regulator
MDRSTHASDTISFGGHFSTQDNDTDRGALAQSGPHRKQPAVTEVPPVAFDLFAVIDDRVLERECFVLCLQQQFRGSSVVGFGSVSDWRNAVGQVTGKQIILHNIGAKRLTDEDVKAGIKTLIADAKPVPVVILGACDDVDSVIAALECGAVGYIPPSIHFQNIIEAACLALAGGVFLSRKSLFSFRDSVPSLAVSGDEVIKQFTNRQRSVAQVLRRGAANKTIAYELDLRESTVKVHVRQIFKKLKATNRTQAAFLLNQMSGWTDEAVRPN